MPEPITLALGAVAAASTVKVLWPAKKRKSPLPPPPSLPIDEGLARRLAPVFAADYERYLGFYDQGLLRRVKEAAGLRTRRGTVNPVYAGTSAGALKYFGVSAPPRPLPSKLPASLIPYLPPRAITGARASGFGVGAAPAIAAAVTGAALGVMTAALKIAEAIDDANWRGRAEDVRLGYQEWKRTLHMLDILAQVYPWLRVRGTDRIYRHVWIVANASWRSMDAGERTWHTPIGSFAFPYLDYGYFHPEDAGFPFNNENWLTSSVRHWILSLGWIFDGASDAVRLVSFDTGAPAIGAPPEGNPLRYLYLQSIIEPEAVGSALGIEMIPWDRMGALRWAGWTTYPDPTAPYGGVEETDGMRSRFFLDNVVKADPGLKSIIIETLQEANNDPWRYFPLDPSETTAQQKVAGDYSVPSSILVRQNPSNPNDVRIDVLGSVGFVPPPADATLENLTRKLKQMNPAGGYDYGIVALYQDRRGLPVTGRLDGPTLASLAPQPAPTAPAASPTPSGPTIYDPLAAYRVPTLGLGGAFERYGVTIPGVSASDVVPRTPISDEPEGEAKKLGLLRDSADVQLAIALAHGVLRPNEPPRMSGPSGQRPAELLQGYQAHARTHPGSWAESLIKLVEVAIRGPEMNDEATDMPMTPEEMLAALRRMTPSRFDPAIVTAYQRQMGLPVTGKLDQTTIDFIAG